MNEDESRRDQRKRLARKIQRIIGGKYTTILREVEKMPFEDVKAGLLIFRTTQQPTRLSEDK